MSYNEFTIETLKERFQIEMNEDDNLFSQTSTVPVPKFLTELLKRYVPLAITISTEKARSEWIIAPILAEFKFQFKEQTSLFSGIDFNIDKTK